MKDQPFALKLLLYIAITALAYLLIPITEALLVNFLWQCTVSIWNFFWFFGLAFAGTFWIVVVIAIAVLPYFYAWLTDYVWENTRPVHIIMLLFLCFYYYLIFFVEGHWYWRNLGDAAVNISWLLVTLTVAINALGTSETNK